MLRKWGDIITFGKYKGFTVRQICDKDANYLDWLMEATKRTKFDDEMKYEIQLACHKQNYDKCAEYLRDDLWNDFQT